MGTFHGEFLSSTWRLTTNARQMPDEYALSILNLLSLKEIPTDTIDSISICSVVPPVTQVFEHLCKNYFSAQTLIVGTGTKTGIKILYDNPRDVGTDRIVDAAAAYTLYGGPLIIVDFGTVTVFDAITSKGEYLGGALAPGLAMGATAMVENTSILRRVELINPIEPIGKNTPHAMQSGLVLGHIDMVEGMIKRFKQELGQNAKVIATGGLSDLITRNSSMFDNVNEDLTLIGLRLIYNMNLTNQGRKEIP